MIRKLFLLMAALLTGLTATARERQNFDKDWRFMLADSVQMAQAEYDDSSWRQLDVPHDWAIEGDFYEIVVGTGAWVRGCYYSNLSQGYGCPQGYSPRLYKQKK